MGKPTPEKPFKFSAREPIAGPFKSAIDLPSSDPLKDRLVKAITDSARIDRKSLGNGYYKYYLGNPEEVAAAVSAVVIQVLREPK